jgi:hypothetical protein
MIHALHGNFGLPTDWDAALPPAVPARAWHLWEIRRHHPEARTLTGFATWFNDQVAALPDRAAHSRCPVARPLPHGLLEKRPARLEYPGRPFRSQPTPCGQDH